MRDDFMSVEKLLKTAIIIAVAAVVMFSGCNTKNEIPPRIAASNSYIESAVIDILGKNERILRLAEPGMCPGHFDIQPSQVDMLRRCKLILKFDFQKLVEERILDKNNTNTVIVSIKPGSGLCCPKTYLAVCLQTADALVTNGFVSKQEVESRLKEIALRLQELEKKFDTAIRESGLKDEPVLASAHQKEFCKWLGLNVVGSFTAADITGFQEIENAIDAGKLKNVRFIIANKPEGRRLADALADRLKAKVVVFGNFPEGTPFPVFDNLVLNNVEALVKSAAKR
ncbi:MAG: metal ABC transporter solute-binding protein, Zn/Mn family [Verrucomicrobiia bacterium]